MKTNRRSIFLALFGMLLLAPLGFAQTGKIRGTVTDSDGAGLFQATITLVGKSLGATTDDKGAYEIKGLTEGKYTISYVNDGYKSETRDVTLAAGQDLVVNVTLKDASSGIDEVVVIGYGTTRTKDLTGAATIITDKNFVQGSVSTPEQLIMGKSAGVKITSNDGAPGSGSTIRMRGGTSINASNDPLIVVDGVPLDNGGISGASNPLALINPNDIASFVILKDASATAIYGSRAANGVILVTTKRGDANKFKVSFESKHSVSTIAKYADVLTGDDFRALVNAKGTATQKGLLGSSNTDWQREVFRAAYTMDNNVSVSGGLKKLPYRISIGNRNENGILLDDYFNRTSFAMNLTPSFFKNTLTSEVNMRYVETRNNFANRGALGAAYFDPTQPVYSGNEAFGGYYEWVKNGKPNVLAPRNPLGLIKQRQDVSNVHRLIANAKLSYKFPFVTGLKAVVNVGVDQATGAGTVNTLASSASGYYSRGSYSEYRQEKNNQLIEAYLNYNKTSKNTKHILDLTGGYSFQNWNTSSPNNPTYNEARDSIISPANPNPFFTENALLSFYGRGIYTFNDKYVFNTSLRYDGSSRFSPETRWGFFPSASAAYVISQEKFMKNVKWINLLKLRAGWGVTGQQDGIGDYSYIGNYFPGQTTAQYAFGGQYYTTFRPNGYDANLKWETTSSINIGVDFGLKNDRISGSIDVYQKNTSDLLATVSVPAGTNFTNAILTNVGGMKNTGIEVMTNFGLIAKKDLRLDMMANATFNKNEVTKLAQINDPKSPGILVGGISGIANTIQIHQIGMPTFSYFVYEQQYDGSGNMIQEGQQATIDVNNDGQITTADKWKDIHAFVDRNNDGKINIDDRYITRQAAPKVFLGLSFNLTYKNWFAGLSMRSELGGTIYNNIHSNNATYQAINGTLGFLNNISNLYYEDEVIKNNERQLLSDHYLEKANFLRMDYLNVGRKFDKMSVALTVSNVFVLTKYKGLDPEIGGGIDNNSYPRPRMYSLNFTFNF